MDTPWEVLNQNIFLLPGEAPRSILYAPLQGVVMEVNRPFVERLKRAILGDAEAAKAIGLDLSIVERFVCTPAHAKRQIEPEWTSAFEPTSVTIFLTHKCTLRCAYCYCHGGVGTDMPWAVLERAVLFALDNARRQKRDFQLGFHGGDVGACWPLFQRAVAFIEDACGRAGVKPVMSIGTNGFYTDEQATYIAKHIGSATVSIDGAAAVHDENRATASGQPSLERILNTVGIFEAHDVCYSVRMTVTDKSVESLAESVDFICRNTRTASIRAEPLYLRGRATGTRLRAPDPVRFVAMFREARAVAKEHGRLLEYSGARLSGVFGSFCSYPSPTFGVTPEGNLTCCYEILHPEDPLSPLFFYGRMPADGSSITVDQARVGAIRALARLRRVDCARCFCVFACAGDCAAKVTDTALSTDEAPGRCRITRALVHDMLLAILAGGDPLQASAGWAKGNAPSTAGGCLGCDKPGVSPRVPGEGSKTGQGSAP